MRKKDGGRGADGHDGAPRWARTGLASGLPGQATSQAVAEYREILTMKNADFVATAAQKIIEALEQGYAPWTKPWKAGTKAALEISGTTRKPYRGINQLMLSLSNPTGSYSREPGNHDYDPRWYTFKGAQQLDARVKKGAKGTPIVYASTLEKSEAREDGDQKIKKIWYEKVSYVFHASCIDGLDKYMPPSVEPLAEHGINDLAERMIANYLSRSNVSLVHAEQDQAFYSPAFDTVTMPLKGQFLRLGGYYSTLLHELGHSTGHHSRLDRFKKYSYGMEELIAEMTSHFLSTFYGIEHDPSSHASYIGGWAKMIKADPGVLITASKEANKAMNLITEGFQDDIITEAEAEAA